MSPSTGAIWPIATRNRPGPLPEGVKISRSGEADTISRILSFIIAFAAQPPRLCRAIFTAEGGRAAGIGRRFNGPA